MSMSRTLLWQPIIKTINSTLSIVATTSRNDPVVYLLQQSSYLAI